MNMLDIMLEPFNWSSTYGPYSAYSWQIYKDSVEDYVNNYPYMDVDAMYEERECYMDYSSMEVI